MSNVCEYKVEKMEFELIDGQPTLIEILTELNRLKLENEFLKADNRELQKEVFQLRSDINVLHNIINGNNENTDDIGILNEYEEEYLCGCENEENLKAMQQAYAEFV